MSKPLSEQKHGGMLVADVLKKQGVTHLYTLCGGHISPILVASEKQGICIIDTRHEVNAVFAADAHARLTGIPGVVAVTAGPGVTNALTALKNAQMAQSPVVLSGGAAATLLKGRGALQDINQLKLVKPIVKWAGSAKRVKDIIPLLEKAFEQARLGVPGPVFLELAVDLLYQEELIRNQLVGVAGKGVTGKITNLYLNRHVDNVFNGGHNRPASAKQNIPVAQASTTKVQGFVNLIQKAQKPVMIIGSQALLDVANKDALQKAILQMGIPSYLSGMARGLLGKNDLHRRHKRSQALKEADLIVLAGVPCDFRLNYGRSIPSKATHVSINRSQKDLTMNKQPDLALLADPGETLREVADFLPADIKENWADWHTKLKKRDEERDRNISEQARQKTDYVNPVAFCHILEQHLDRKSILIGDGGDFVATASYILRPRAPLSWLDPGPFGTLGVGAGFAMAAKANKPDHEVWLLYGDGSAGYSLTEFDTFVRHKLPIIAIVGNDASWAQIAREQVEILGTALGTELEYSNYHDAVKGLGAKGLLISKAEEVEPALKEARQLAQKGHPVLVNVLIGKTDFRKGSISI